MGKKICQCLNISVDDNGGLDGKCMLTGEKVAPADCQEFAQYCPALLILRAHPGSDVASGFNKDYFSRALQSYAEAARAG